MNIVADYKSLENDEDSIEIFPGIYLDKQVLLSRFSVQYQIIAESGNIVRGGNMCQNDVQPVWQKMIINSVLYY